MTKKQQKTRKVKVWVVVATGKGVGKKGSVEFADYLTEPLCAECSDETNALAVYDSKEQADAQVAIYDRQAHKVVPAYLTYRA